MRKLFVTLATVGFLLTAASCSKEGTETVFDGKNDISFNAAIGKSTVTRAKEFTYWASGNTLDIAAYKAGDALFETFTLAYNGSAWTQTAPAAAVPQPGYALAYYSWYPKTAFTTGTPTVANYTPTYTVAATAAAQVDVIAARVAPTTDAEITLNYKHVLSQVNFALVNSFGLVIEVTDMKVYTANSAGTYSFAANSWTVSGTPATYVYTPLANSNKTDGTGTGAVVSMIDDVSPGNRLMLMPQPFTAEDNGYFTFDFKLKAAGTDDATIVSGNDVKVNFCDFDISTWAPGKNYVYILDFTNYLKGGPIVFNVKVDEWANAVTPWEEVAQTIEVADATVASIQAAIDAQADVNAETPGLKVFPIAVPTALAAEVTNALTITGFDTGDQIRVEFVDFDSADEFKVTAAGWTVTAAITPARVVTLTCTAPNVGTAATVVATTGDQAGIEAAIAAQLAVNKAAPRYTVFPIDASASAAAAITIDDIGDGFNFGDVIRITCADDASQSNIALDNAIKYEAGVQSGWVKSAAGLPAVTAVLTYTEAVVTP